MNALRFLDEQGAEAVASAVRRAEARSAIEVVCVVATESGRYDRAESFVGFVFALIAFLVTWSGLPGAREPGTWAAVPSATTLVLALALGFALGTVVASYAHGLRRLLVSPGEQLAEVERGAAAAFTRLQLTHTRRRTGVMVYVSLFERRVVVLLDEGARAVAPEGLADRLCQQAIDGLRAGKRAEVLVSLIEATADAFAEALPADPSGANELRDGVVLLHPR